MGIMLVNIQFIQRGGASIEYIIALGATLFRVTTSHELNYESPFLKDKIFQYRLCKT